MKSGELAKRAKINVETIRYYERNNLLPKAQRRASGYRIFSETDVRRIRFIKRAQELGFTLREIKELLSLSTSPEADRTDVRQLAEQKIADISERIRDLQRMQETLREIAHLCHGHGSTSDCPILQALETGPAGSGELQKKGKENV